MVFVFQPVKGLYHCPPGQRLGDPGEHGQAGQGEALESQAFAKPPQVAGDADGGNFRCQCGVQLVILFGY